MQHLKAIGALAQLLTGDTSLLIPKIWDAPRRNEHFHVVLNRALGNSVLSKMR